jgi:type VI secretion system protein VasD
MMQRRPLLAALSALVLPLLLQACAAAPPPPATLTLLIKAGTDQNPDPSNTPSPVAVRVFQLAATARFERADYFALEGQEKATLGQEGLGSEEFVLRPGETREIRRELKKDTQFIGVAVGFRDIDRSTWRAIAPVPSTGPVHLTLTISGLKATLARD